MKLSRFGIYTCGRVCAFIASWGMLRAYPASVRITITTVVKLRIGIFTSPHTEPRESPSPHGTAAGVSCGSGDIGEAGHYEQLALDDTPHIASRLQNLAEPDTVVPTKNRWHMSS